MADDNKNLAGDTERTSILPQSEPQVADQTEVLPTGASQAQTVQRPPVTQQEGAGAFAGTPPGVCRGVFYRCSVWRRGRGGWPRCG